MASIVTQSTPVNSNTDTITIDASTDRLLVFYTSEDASITSPACTINTTPSATNLTVLPNTPVENSSGGINAIVVFELPPSQMPDAGTYTVTATPVIANGDSFTVVQIRDSIDAAISVTNAQTGQGTLNFTASASNDDALGIVGVTSQSSGASWTLTGVTALTGFPHDNGNSSLMVASAAINTGAFSPTAYDNNAIAREAGLLVIVENGVSETLTITEDDAPFGATINYSTTGLGTITGATAQDGSGNIMTLTSVTDTSAEIPSVGNNVQRCLTGPVTITVTDGSSNASDTLGLQPPADRTAQTVIVGFSTSPPSWLQGFSGTVEVDDQALYLTDDYNIVDGLGGYERVSPGVSLWYYIDESDGIMQSYSIQSGSQDVPSGSSRNSLLGQIVIAAGGTITDPSNRNKLLQDWLDAIS